MLKKDELRTLKLLFKDLSKNLTISDITRILRRGYFQVHQSVHSLAKKEDVIIEKVGNSKVIRPNLKKPSTNQVFVEMERADDVCINTTLNVVRKSIKGMNKNFICILFGSQANKPNETSDIDLLFIIPEEYNYAKFESLVKDSLVGYNCDINIVTEKGMLEMWKTPNKFNVGNEILKNHVVLYGAEYFLNILRQYYVG
ncbi:nucleotidyltransferase domain-containing protein [Candidatus Woesearchaeota archaeon]|nr:nucleotidyltransferase domain-containing protein [Candidatus Woesearchaeota archaeon]